MSDFTIISADFEAKWAPPPGPRMNEFREDFDRLLRAADKVRDGVARPGDTLIVGYDQRLSDEEYSLLRERFRPLMDAGIKVLLVENAKHLVLAKVDVS